jgi:hypothetical protein
MFGCGGGPLAALAQSAVPASKGSVWTDKVDGRPAIANKLPDFIQRELSLINIIKLNLHTFCNIHSWGPLMLEYGPTDTLFKSKFLLK